MALLLLGARPDGLPSWAVDLWSATRLVPVATCRSPSNAVEPRPASGPKVPDPTYNLGCGESAAGAWDRASITEC